MIVKCKRCERELEHHAKGLCITCYKKELWSPKLTVCKRCKIKKPLHAKGLCPGCYNFVFMSEKNKAWNYKKWHNIDTTLYKKITKKCIICGFDKIVELHHLDEDKKNNSPENLIGLCPNHHKMLHNFKFRQGIKSLLKEKGFELTFDPKLDFFNEKRNNSD